MRHGPGGETLTIGISKIGSKQNARVHAIEIPSAHSPAIAFCGRVAYRKDANSPVTEKFVAGVRAPKQK